jgi:hypothetical protein
MGARAYCRTALIKFSNTCAPWAIFSLSLNEGPRDQRPPVQTVSFPSRRGVWSRNR